VLSTCLRLPVTWRDERRKFRGAKDAPTGRRGPGSDHHDVPSVSRDCHIEVSSRLARNDLEEAFPTQFRNARRIIAFSIAQYKEEA
jgi:hypothetical protein